MNIYTHIYKTTFCFKTILILSTFLTLNIFGQDIDYEWVKHFGGQQSDGGRDICKDQEGNIYVTGFFRSTAKFDNTELTSKGDTDIFLAKIDRDGHLKWVKQYGGEATKNLIITELGTSVCCGKDGSIYLTGIFSQSATFGDTVINSIGGDDIFIAKINSGGRLLWVNNYGSSAHDYVYDITVDQNNNILMSGLFGKMPENVRSGKDGSFAILARINSSGTLEVLNNISSTQFIEPKSIITDKQNNIYWGINFHGNVNVDEKQFESLGSSDFLIVKSGELGNTSWIRHIGGKGNDRMNQLLSTNDNTLTLAGFFEEKVTIEEKTIKSNGKTDFLLSRFDEEGNIIWLDHFGGKSDDKAISIAETKNGDFIVGGIFQDVVKTNFDTLQSSGYYDIVLLSFNENKQLKSSIQIGNETGDFINSMVIDKDIIYFSGTFREELVVENEFFNSSGSEDILILSRPVSAISHTESEDITQKISFTAQPNPSTGKISISTNSNQNIVVDLDITDIKGERVLLFKNKHLPQLVDLSLLSNGIYFVSILYGEKTYVEKVVIKH